MLCGKAGVHMEEERQDILSGDVEVLKEIIQKVTLRDELKEKLDDLGNQKKKLQNEWKRLQEQMETETNQELEKARQIATAEEDKILKEEEKELKETRQKRERVKKQGIRSRMEQETSDFVELNKANDKKIRKLIKENDLPLICNSKAFFVMYSPENLQEWVIRVAVLLVLLLGVPGLLVWILDPWLLWKILLWILVDLVIAAIYITIYLVSKDKDIGALEEIREIREKIEESNRKIKKIKQNIKQDTDESTYGLEEFDASLKTIEETIAFTQAKKEEKLQKFKESNEGIVIEQVKESYRKNIEMAQAQVELVANDYDAVNIQLAEQQAFITDRYEKYIDTALLEPEKLKKLLTIMQNQQAKTIQEALDLSKSF